MDFSDVEILNKQNKCHSQEIIGTNKNSLYVLFSRTQKANYRSKKSLIIRSYDKESLVFNEDVNLKSILKEHDMDSLILTEVIDEKIVNVFRSKFQGFYQIKGLLLDKHLRVTRFIDNLHRTTMNRNYLKVLTNQVLGRIVIIDYPSTFNYTIEVGSIKVFDLNLDMVDQASLDLSFLSSEKSFTTNNNIKKFLVGIEFSTTYQLVNTIEIKTKNPSSTKKYDFYPVLFIFNLFDATHRVINLDEENILNIKHVALYMEGDRISISGFI